MVDATGVFLPRSVVLCMCVCVCVLVTALRVCCVGRTRDLKVNWPETYLSSIHKKNHTINHAHDPFNLTPKISMACIELG